MIVDVQGVMRGGGDGQVMLSALFELVSALVRARLL
jgi:hypothetical protein